MGIFGCQIDKDCIQKATKTSWGLDDPSARTLGQPRRTRRLDANPGTIGHHPPVIEVSGGQQDGVNGVDESLAKTRVVQDQTLESAESPERGACSTAPFESWSAKRSDVVQSETTS